MPREFVASSSQQLNNGTTSVVTAYPFTLAAWARATTAANGFQNVIAMGDGATANDNEIVLGFADTGGIRATIAKSQTVGSATTTAATNGAWTHLCGVFTSATSRDAYRDGANKASNATNLVFPAVDRVAMSWRPVTGGANYLTGAIAEAAAWSVALDAAEVAALAKGVCPTLIRPTALLAYWPLWGNESPEPDRWRSKISMTLSGTPTKSTDGVHIYYPSQVA
jgi:hypothetical protein